MRSFSGVDPGHGRIFLIPWINRIASQHLRHAQVVIILPLLAWTAVSGLFGAVRLIVEIAAIGQRTIEFTRHIGVWIPALIIITAAIITVVTIITIIIAILVAHKSIQKDIDHATRLVDDSASGITHVLRVRASILRLVVRHPPVTLRAVAGLGLINRRQRLLLNRRQGLDFDRRLDFGRRLFLL